MLPYTTLLQDLDNLDYEIVKSNKKITYLNIEAAFDIETTSMKIGETKVAFMYVWMFGIEFGKETYYGRTWEEFVTLCEGLQKSFQLNDKRRLVVYVHNLGYEFQFMRKYFEWTEVFSGSERKPMKAFTSLGIEFRDSYILSGYSLASTAKNLHSIKISKMVGDLDYSLIRTSDTPLTTEEWKYCDNDIQIILAYIKEQIAENGNITKIPLTNTGRVRKYVRDYCYYKKSDGSKAGKGQYMRYRELMGKLTLDTETYKQLKQTFMGGFTHANAGHSNKLLKDVTSIDFTSSYPAVMVSEKFPMTRFLPRTVENMDEFEVLCGKYAVLFDAKFEGVTPILEQENYLSVSKCSDIEGAVTNNGRIVAAKQFNTSLTEVDYEIMKQCYSWESISVRNVKVARKGYLPKPIIESILRLYQGKTELKDVVGSEVEYMHSKGMLNSIYGMCVTDVVKEQAEYAADNGGSSGWTTNQPDVDETVVDYNESKNRFLYYAWGVWVTAYARRNLWTGILAVGSDYVYSDTDSLKVLNWEKHIPYTKWYDKMVISKMEAMCDEYGIDKKLLRPKTKDGVEKVLGVWDYEGTYPMFKTLGAKRYLVLEKNGRLALTVAGLSKRNGVDFMSEVCGGDPAKVFEMFSNNLHIPAEKTGKMTHTYVDEEFKFQVTDYLGKKSTVETLSGVHLEPCDFTLTLSDNYIAFMKQFVEGYTFKGVRYV